MAAPIMGKKPTGERKPWVPTIVKWPINLGRAAWLFLLVAVATQVGLQIAAGEPPGPEMLLDLRILAAAGLAILLALGAVVGGFIHPLSRGKAIVNAAIAVVLGAGLVGHFVITERMARAEAAAEAQANENARKIVQDGWIASKLLPPHERTPRYTRAVRAAEAVATGPHREQFTVVGAGLDTIAQADEELRSAAEAFERAGGIAVEGLTSKNAIAERQKLLAALKAETQEHLAVLRRVSKEWNAKLVPPVATDRERETVLRDFVYVAIEENNRQLELDAEREKVLAALDASFGRWALKKDQVVFRKKADEEPYRAALAKLASLKPPAIAAVTGTPSPAETAPGDVKGETLAEDDARDYAMSYVTLVQRGQFDEAYKYLPPDVTAKVAAPAHATHWTTAAGGQLEELRVESPVTLDGGKLGYKVSVPGKEPVVVVVLKQSGKIYAVPAALAGQ